MTQEFGLNVMVLRTCLVSTVATVGLTLSVGQALSQTYQQQAPAYSQNGAAQPYDPNATQTYAPAAAPPYAGNDPYAAQTQQSAPYAQQPQAVPQPYGQAPYSQPNYANGQQPAPNGQQPAPYGQQASQPYGQQPAPYGQQPAPYGTPAYNQQPAHTASVPGATPPGSVGGESSAMGANGSSVAMLPAEDQPEEGQPKELPPNLRRQLVDYPSKEPAGTVIIDTPNTHLYLIMGDGKAMRYGIGVGRDGFTWAGTEKVTRKAEWPDWRPPAEMIQRQPYLPRFMAGGPGNPMGARAMYLGATVYRIHGTNQPSTIGSFVSSGCIRLVNDDVEDLFDRVKVGSRVIVLPSAPKTAAVSQDQQPTVVGQQVQR